MRRIKLWDIVLAGVLAALVCAASWIRIPLPSPVGNTAIHLGNVMCILAGLLLGPVPGGLAAGIGSGLFDLIYPGYAASAPFTLIFKFFIGFFTGLIAFSGDRRGTDMKRNLTGAIVGSLAYIVLYLTRSYLTAVYVNLMQVEPALVMLVPKAATSLLNGAIAVACAVPLAPVIRTALDRAGIRIDK